MGLATLGNNVSGFACGSFVIGTVLSTGVVYAITAASLLCYKMSFLIFETSAKISEICPTSTHTEQTPFIICADGSEVRALLNPAVR